MRAAGAPLAAATLLLFGCGGGGDGGMGPDTTPGVPARLVFVSGPPSTDTVDAETPIPLVFSVRDSAGRPVPRGRGHLQVVGTPFAAVVRLLDPGQNTFQVDAEADSTGTLRVAMSYGRVAGEAMVEYRIPGGARADTLRFTVIPGAPARIVLAPLDTALALGRSLTPRVDVRDHFGNSRPDAVGFSAAGPELLVSGASAAAARVGVGILRAQVGAIRDSVKVTVVPNGTLAAYDERGRAIVLLDLDGSHRRRLAPMEWAVGGPGIAWATSGDRLYVSKSAPISHRLFEVDLQGGEQALTPPTGTTLINALWPSVAANGQWVYFSGEPVLGGFAVWRVRPDGTGLEPVATAQGPGEIGYALSVAPDESAIAYTTSLQPTADIRVRSLATGLPLGRAWNGAYPAWSPTGARIAFMELGGRLLRLLDPISGDARTLAPDYVVVGGQVTWSPDGAWLVLPGSLTLELVDATTGRHFPLPYTAELSAPAWQPVAP